MNLDYYAQEHGNGHRRPWHEREHAFYTEPNACGRPVTLRAHEIPCVSNFMFNAYQGRCVSAITPCVCPSVPLCPKECIDGIIVAGTATQNAPATLSVPVTLDPAVYGNPPYTINGITFPQGSAAVWNLSIVHAGDNVHITGQVLAMMNATVSSATVTGAAFSTLLLLPLDVTIPYTHALPDPLAYVTLAIASAAATYDDLTGTLNVTLTGGVMNVTLVTGAPGVIPIYPRMHTDEPICPYAAIQVLTPACACPLPAGTHGPYTVTLPALTGTPPFTVRAVSFANTQPGVITTSALQGRLILPMTVTVADSTGVTDTFVAYATANIAMTSSCGGMGATNLLMRIATSASSYTYDAAANTLSVTLSMTGQAIAAAPAPQTVNMLTYTLPCAERPAPACMVSIT